MIIFDLFLMFQKFKKMAETLNMYCISVILPNWSYFILKYNCFQILHQFISLPKGDEEFHNIKLTIRVFIYICPNIVRGILVTLWRHFSYHLVFPPRLWDTFEGQKQKFAVRLRSNFSSNFGHLFGPFNPVFFIFISKI